MLYSVILSALNNSFPIRPEPQNFVPYLNVTTLLEKFMNENCMLYWSGGSEEFKTCIHVYQLQVFVQLHCLKSHNIKLAHTGQ